MPLPLPRLDERTFDQLVEEARETLPASAPGWTDHNVSDPGITLIELFAYLTEIGLYRLDRVLPAQHRAYLRLLGYPPAAARIAQTVIAFQQRLPGLVVELPAGVQVGSDQGSIAFQTGASVAVVAARMAVVQTQQAGEFTDWTAANAALAGSFAPLGTAPAAGDALYLGFDRPLGPEGTPVRLHVFGEDPERDRRAWPALAAEARAARREIRATCSIDALRGSGRYWEHYGARVVWEYHDASGSWLPLRHVRDRTRALSISGAVRFHAPRPAFHAPGGVPGNVAAYFVRCRLGAGEYDCAPLIRGVRVNAVVARHDAEIAQAEPLGTSAGRARETFRTARSPVVPSSTQLEAILPGGIRESWTEVREWDRTGPHDRHYVLRVEPARIEFGDGRQGRVPPAGAALQLRYRVGGGAAGNVAAGTLTRLLADGPNAAIPGWNGVRAGLLTTQPLAALGGEPEESISAAEGRAVSGIGQARCAATLADFERLALSAPALPVARAHAVADFHPDLSCLPAAGSVTVVIVPKCVEFRRDPTPALCREVGGFLERRRPVATEVHVTGPRYTKVTVHARLRLAAGADRAAAVARAREELDRFFHPLRGGPAGGGWPVGRDVYRSEVLAVLAAQPGVLHVTCLELQEGDDGAARCGNVPLCAHGLVDSGEHRITAE